MAKYESDLPWKLRAPQQLAVPHILKVGEGVIEHSMTVSKWISFLSTTILFWVSYVSKWISFLSTTILFWVSYVLPYLPCLELASVNNNTVLGILCFTLFTLFGTRFSRAFTANFVFGDSLVEVGNNNYIPSLSRANNVPNLGIDFGWPTGRFTNRRTIVDIIGQELGFETFTPPHLAPSSTGPMILRGVNYASGSAGIFNNTGKIFLARINLVAQVDNFANNRQDIIDMIGLPAAMDLLRTSIFSITIGSNDFINNYFTPVLSDSGHRLIPPELFVGSMISSYRLQLTRLYNLGARNIVVVNVGPIGCIPYQRDSNPSLGSNCANSPNLMAQLFNNQLRGLITELGAQFQNSNFLYANAYHIVQDIVQNHASYGFENADSACCHIAGRHGGLFPCGPPSRVCVDRSKYVFWDSFHPSEATNSIIARRLMDGDANDIWPINIRELERFN
ncbi:LOW QUALITY PROTEIN: GDSL esterase/lipase At4g16230-like [Cucurbita moschata]|uniref:LOW QUALITY PROTEIN: GDSL esterase/lipase At4g16230-like n=1 Tax=Cucurbita moschata TaxID=3662 RepID=A0A6J1GYI0_CUCMO|nr:LOW QUALITY PROTEIN: GDSL esterase/lipase At4g16230-like [Cucurbita moschata]